MDWIPNVLTPLPPSFTFSSWYSEKQPETTVQNTEIQFGEVQSCLDYPIYIDPSNSAVSRYYHQVYNHDTTSVDISGYVYNQGLDDHADPANCLLEFQLYAGTTPAWVSMPDVNVASFDTAPALAYTDLGTYDFLVSAWYVGYNTFDPSHVVQFHI